MLHFTIGKWVPRYVFAEVGSELLGIVFNRGIDSLPVLSYTVEVIEAMCSFEKKTREHYLLSYLS